MRKLVRKWRNYEDDKLFLPTRDDPAFDDSRPMDTQDQEELVRSLERSHARQSRLWRTVFAAFLCGYILVLLYSIFLQASSPWEVRYHAYFMEDVYSWMIISADWVAVLACTFAIIGLLHGSIHHRRWIWYSWFTGIIPAVFWLYCLLRLPKFRWDVMWLPFGPLGAAAICLYVDHLLTESSEEVKKLRGYMYAYKEPVGEEKHSPDKGEAAYRGKYFASVCRGRRGHCFSEVELDAVFEIGFFTFKFD